MCDQLPGMLSDDLQRLSPEDCWPISSVGIVESKELVRVCARDGSFTTIGAFDMVIDLPSHLRGIHMSRNTEAINEALWDTLYEDYRSPTGELLAHDLGQLCAEVAQDLLGRHTYASKAVVRYRGDYFVSKRTPVTSRMIQEVYGLSCEAVSIRESSGVLTSIELGVEVVGATVCPCAQNEYGKLLWHRTEEHLSEAQFNSLLQMFALPSHMQRVVCQLSVEMPQEDYGAVQIEDLIEVAEGALSIETYELLKREDELHMVEKAFRNPLFVEDVVRRATTRVMERYYPTYPTWRVVVETRSQESIHKHDAIARIESTLEELADSRSDKQPK